ncbi:MAG: hypothetical protein KF816_02885 [Melioribacteraceae bacterium]|nr:hypothetical protein [Melioribacteraceae bacterium]
MSTVTFKISIPAPEGFIGNICININCKKYFKVSASDIKDEMFCPYCGTSASKMDLRTIEQNKYIREAAMEKAKEIAYKEIDKMFGNLARSSSSNKYFTVKHTPMNYRAKNIRPSYSEKSVDTELKCPCCNVSFQVYGIFGFCPGCRIENMIIYDTNIQIIKKEYENSDNKERALRHAYSDLVSTFERFCQNKSESIKELKPSFQELFEARKFFKAHFTIDIFSDLLEPELLSLRRVFQKRHTYVHSDGSINEKYVKKIPEDNKLLGTKAVLTFEEFWEAALLLRKVIDKLIIIKL